MEDFKLNGLIAAPVTPFHEDGELNLGVVGDYVDFLLRQGIKQVYLSGYTGEGPTMTTNERKELAEKWVKESRGKLDTIIVQIGGTTLKDSQELAIHARKIGATAIASLPPLFYPSTVSSLVEYFCQLTSVVPDMPFMYYHIPGVTHVHVIVSEFLQAAKDKVPSLVGVKYTHNDFIDLERCLAVSDGKFQIALGCDEGLLIGLQLGISSAVGSTYNYQGKLSNGIVDAFKEGDMKEAWRLQHQAQDNIKAILKYGNGPEVPKAVLNMVGFKAGPPRLPMQALSQESVEALRKDLMKVGFVG